jgi:TRAP-type C4-dicarboxylate transport system permease small subunit
MSDILHTTADLQKDSRSVRLLLGLTAVLVAAIVIVTLGQVILRYFFNNPQSWAEEIGRYLFVWITLLGAAVAVARDSHIRLDAVVNLLPKITRGPLDIFRRLVEIVAGGMLLWAGIAVTSRNLHTTFYTLPDVPRWIFYGAIPVGAALMLIYAGRNLILLLAKR